jgi:HlyD family secretion protein
MRGETLSTSLKRNLIAGTASIILLFGGVSGWATTADLASAVVASGTIVVDGSVKKVQSPESGIVVALLVNEGQLVHAGETLVRMDDTVTRSNLASVEKNIAQLQARLARLEAERDGRTQMAVGEDGSRRLTQAQWKTAQASEWQLFEDRRRSRQGEKAQISEQILQLREQIGGVQEQLQAKDDELAMIAKELEGKRRLYDIGVLTLGQINSLDRSAARLRGERGQAVANIAASKARIAELELRLLQVDQQLRADVAVELRDTINTLATLEDDEVTARDKLKHTDIKAPATGVVHLLAIHTIGGVVTPAETLMEIVPQNSVLTVDAQIAPRDIDQINIGQPADLRFSAFNRNTTPELRGSVIRVSADMETDKTTGTAFYRAAVSIPESEVRRLNGLVLVPGMPAETFIRTGDRKVISYFLKPIRDHMERAFRQE